MGTGFRIRSCANKKVLSSDHEPYSFHAVADAGRRPPVGDRDANRARHRAAVARARLFGGERIAAAVRPPRRSGGARLRRHGLDRGDQVVGRRFPRRPEMARLPRPLRPAVLRHLHGRAERDLPARHRADRGRQFRRRVSWRSARTQAAGGDAQVDDAVVRPRRRAAPAGAQRSEWAVWGCDCKSEAPQQPPLIPAQAGIQSKT